MVDSVPVLGTCVGGPDTDDPPLPAALGSCLVDGSSVTNIDGFPDKIPLGATDDINGDAAAVGTVDGEEAGMEEPTLE